MHLYFLIFTLIHAWEILCPATLFKWFVALTLLFFIILYSYILWCRYSDDELKGLQKQLEKYWRNFNPQAPPSCLVLADGLKEKPDVWIEPKQYDCHFFVCFLFVFLFIVCLCILLVIFNFLLVTFLFFFSFFLPSFLFLSFIIAHILASRVRTFFVYGVFVCSNFIVVIWLLFLFVCCCFFIITFITKIIITLLFASHCFCTSSRVLQIKAAQMVPTEKFKAGYTLRFPRVVNMRTDKAWNEGLAFNGACL